MALTDADKKEIAGLIRAEVEKIKTEIAKPALDIRTLPFDVSGVTRVRERPPRVFDQCCNGCD